MRTGVTDYTTLCGKWGSGNRHKKMLILLWLLLLVWVISPSSLTQESHVVCWYPRHRQANALACKWGKIAAFTILDTIEWILTNVDTCCHTTIRSDNISISPKTSFVPLYIYPVSPPQPTPVLLSITSFAICWISYK